MAIMDGRDEAQGWTKPAARRTTAKVKGEVQAVTAIAEAQVGGCAALSQPR